MPNFKLITLKLRIEAFPECRADMSRASLYACLKIHLAKVFIFSCFCMTSPYATYNNSILREFLHRAYLSQYSGYRAAIDHIVSGSTRWTKGTKSHFGLVGWTKTVSGAYIKTSQASWDRVKACEDLTNDNSPLPLLITTSTFTQQPPWKIISSASFRKGKRHQNLNITRGKNNDPS